MNEEKSGSSLAEISTKTPSAEDGPKKNKLSKKMRNLIIAISCGVGALALIVTGYACLINFYLLDFENMEYIEFSYLLNDTDSGQETTVRIDKVYPNSSYPADFRIPNKLLGYRVTEIGDEAFSNLTRLENVTFPNSVYSIGESAFEGCINLKSFNVPSDLSYIGTNAFENTSYLSNQTDGEVLIGDILYLYKGQLPENSAIVANENSVAYTSHTYSNYIFLKDIIMIGSGAFNGKSNLLYVEYPDKFGFVAEKLFENCDNLQQVVLGNSISSIGDYAFDGCSKLSNINWPTSLTSIGDYAFNSSSLSGHIALPNSVSSIGSYAFSNSTSITSFALPSSTYRISDGLLKGCTNLTSFTYDNDSSNLDDNKIEYLGSESFASTGLISFTIPYNVDTIKNSLFKDCKNLVSVKTSLDKVLVVENSIFEGCEKFDSLVLIDANGNSQTADGVVSIPSSIVVLGDSSGSSNLFKGTNIKVLNLENASSIYYLADSICYNCKSLTSVIFPTSSKISSIFSSAFYGCTSLTSVSIPKSVSSIYQNAFEGCSSLNSFTVEADSKMSSFTNSIFKGCVAFTSFTIPSNIQIIDSNAFEGCTGLDYLVIPTTVATINSNAFIHCKSTFALYLELTNGVIPSKFSSLWNANGSEAAFKFYFYSEEEKTSTTIKYWHYVSGVPTPWAL